MPIHDPAGAQIMNRYIKANACRCIFCGESKRGRQSYWNSVKQDFKKEIRRELAEADDEDADVNDQDADGGVPFRSV